MADTENCQVHIENDYISELRKEFKTLTFEQVEKKNGLYITNPINLDAPKDLRIFIENQVKRLLRGYMALFVSQTVKKKLSYFSKDEDKDKSEIYSNDDAHNVKPGERYAIQNIGHATQLIQVPYFNILTDPVMNSLNAFLYPAKTDSRPEIHKMVKIDVVLISHNHRDHVDTDSLKKIQQHYREETWTLPKVFVPLGDKKLFEDLGYKEVEEVDWFTKIRLSKMVNGMEKTVDVISIPSDHWSGRYGYDHHRSLVTGWLVYYRTNNVIFKFSGDTRPLSRDNQMATDAVIWHEIKNNNQFEETLVPNSDSKVEQKSEQLQHDSCHSCLPFQLAIPDIVCLEPSGPNYTRCHQDPIHQTSSYSALLKFIEAENLGKLSKSDPMKFLKKIKTVMMHHNKFELGGDRFNEGLFVFKKLVQYLDCEDLDKELERQDNKLNQHLDYKMLKKSVPFTSWPVIMVLPGHTSLMVHAKDFIIREIRDMVITYMSKDKVKEVLLQNTIFPKIGKRLNDVELANMKTNIESINKYIKKNFSNLS